MEKQILEIRKTEFIKFLMRKSENLMHLIKNQPGQTLIYQEALILLYFIQEEGEEILKIEKEIK